MVGLNNVGFDLPSRVFVLILDGMAVIADTLKAKKRLVEAGFSDEKAEGIVAIFNEADAQLATKLDLELFRKDMKAEMGKLRSDVREEIAGVRSEVKEEIAGVRSEMKAEIAELRSDMDTRFASVDSRFAEMKLLIVKAQFASVMATVAILSALKLFL